MRLILIPLFVFLAAFDGPQYSAASNNINATVQEAYNSSKTLVGASKLFGNPACAYALEISIGGRNVGSRLIWCVPY